MLAAFLLAAASEAAVRPGARVTASTEEKDSWAANAFDGDRGSRWSSTFADHQWLMIDLGRTNRLVGLMLWWENAYASSYEIQLSTDGASWTTAFATDKGDGELDDVAFAPAPARFIRVNCRRRGTAWGFSLFEVSLKTDAEPWGEGEIPDVYLPERWRFQIESPPGRFGGRESPSFDDSSWPSIRTHTSWQDQGYQFDNAFGWYRAGFFIPSAWSNRAPYLQATDLRESCELFLNGELIAQFPASRTPLVIPLKTNLAYDALNVFALRLTGRSGTNGMLGSVLLAASEDAVQNALRLLRRRDPKACSEFAARLQPEGLYPYWLSNRQGFWTVVGADGDFRESLFGEDGTIEVYKSFSISPLLFLDGRLITREDARITHSLEDGFLPLPRVNWQVGGFSLIIRALAGGEPGQSTTYATYMLHNRGTQTVSGRLYLAMRPFELNPPWQWGGMNRIHDLTLTQGVIRANEYRVVPVTPPSAFGVCSTSSVEITFDLQKGVLSDVTTLHDPAGFASGALAYDFQLGPSGMTNFFVALPLYPASPADHTEADVRKTLDGVVSSWEKRILPLPFTCPDRSLLDTARATIGHMLVNRDGLSLQPGSRSYEAAWMRDGAMMGAVLLRFGYTNEFREFTTWYAGHLFPDGRVPAILIIGRNETNAVHEYDSQGQLVYSCAQLWQFTHDTELLKALWPAARRSLEYLADLRRDALDETMKHDTDRRRYYGILPRSVSHEGYYPEPGNHSYWDDFWGLKGWKDGRLIAQVLGDTNAEAWIGREEQELRTALYDSIEATRALLHIDYMPGCAELGDFDPTASAVALTTCGEWNQVPGHLRDRTLAKYYERLSERFKPRWTGSFSPYEFRMAKAFLYAGDRTRAWIILRYLLNARGPSGWRQWAEAVYYPPRQPGYIGDMPHSYAASDFLDAFRSLFVYEDESAGDLVLAAGIPEGWVKGVSTEFAREAPTCWGPISYSLQGNVTQMSARVTGDARVPGKIILKSPFYRPIHEATVNGESCEPTNGGVEIKALPADVVLKF